MPKDIQQVSKTIRDPRQSEPTASPDGNENISRDCCKFKSHYQFFLIKNSKL